MVTQAEAIIEAFKSIRGVRSANEIESWVKNVYGDHWKDFSTLMADMVPASYGGNNSSTVPEYFRVLRRIKRGQYCLIDEIARIT
jgi:hypothetical protein